MAANRAAREGGGEVCNVRPERDSSRSAALLMIGVCRLEAAIDITEKLTEPIKLPEGWGKGPSKTVQIHRKRA